MSENLARKHWSEYFGPRRSYMSETEILDDMYRKTKLYPSSLHLMLNQDRDGMKRAHKVAGFAIREYYGMNDPEFPLPEGMKPEEYSLRIMMLLWERFNEDRKR